MQELAATLEEKAFSALAHSFYESIPLGYQTYCALTAQVACLVLQRLGIVCKLLPCQLWYAGPDRNCVVGFVGNAVPHKWDGHVICASNRFFIDAATRHLDREFGIPIPAVISGGRFELPTQAIARYDFRPSERVWWYHAPANASAPPQEPPELVDRLAALLLPRVQQRLACG
jgi:hypothetical protein